MLFKSFPGKMVRVGRTRIEFDSQGEYSTDDKAHQEALAKAKNVEKVDGRKAKPSTDD